MSEKLLPCPLCGGCPVLTEAMTEHWVSCGTCGASGGMHGRLKLAIAAWNRRTPAPEGEAYAFLGHIIVPKSGVGAVFIDKSEGVPIMGGKGSVVPVYSGPQNVTAPFPPVVPAPEGEVVAWGCFDTNGLDDKLVYRDRRRAEDAAFAFTPSLTVKPLYASPVFPVGGGEAVFVSETCEGEVCWCGKPAVRKVGEEFADDEPNPNRHNLTRYICAHHFAELMGPAGARSVGIAPVVPVGVSEEQRQRVAEIVEAAIERHAPANSIRHTLDDADAIIAALRPTDTGWRDIATAPINERILVWVTGKMMPGARFGSAYRGANGKVIAKPEGGNGDWTKEITYWMPLPSAPTDTGANHD